MTAPPRLPSTEYEFQELKRKHKLRYHACVKCKIPFTHATVYTTMGWRETQISGFCEACFDDLCSEDDQNSSPLPTDQE